MPININVDDLREKSRKLDKTKYMPFIAKVGLRGYLANRIMRNNGFRAVNLNGWYNLWSKVQS